MLSELLPLLLVTLLAAAVPFLASRPENVSLPGGVLAVGIRRQGEAIVSNGDANLKFNDVPTLVGKPDSLKQARELLQGPDGGSGEPSPGKAGGKQGLHGLAWRPLLLACCSGGLAAARGVYISFMA